MKSGKETVQINVGRRETEKFLRNMTLDAVAFFLWKRTQNPRGHLGWRKLGKIGFGGQQLLEFCPL
jgi:hypothetical protein